jgi:hypothetical protein
MYIPNRVREEQLYLADVSREIQNKTMAAFVFHSFKNLHLKASTVIGSLSGIRHYFRAKFCDSRVFEDYSVRGAKTAITLEERKNEEWQPCDKKLPFTLGMVITLVNHVAPLDLRFQMLGVGIQLAFFCLLRQSEYIPNQESIRKKCDHAMKASDVEFELQSLGSEPTLWYNASQVTASMWSKVKTVKFTLRSAKNDGMRTGSVFWFTNFPERIGINIVKVAFDWAVKAGLTPEAYFMSYNKGTFDAEGKSEFRWLRYNEMAGAIKKVAVHFGFKAEEFGTHSPRVGGACTLRAGDASDSMVQLLGRWKTLASSLGYTQAAMLEFDRLQGIMSNPSIFGIRDVKLIHRKVTNALNVPPTVKNGKLIRSILKYSGKTVRFATTRMAV